MIGWLVAWAAAATVDPWVGEWGLDPAKSDDPHDALQRAIRAPVLTGGAATRLSPDGGAEALEADYQKLVTATTGLLAVSGRLGLVASGDEGVQLTFGGEAPVELTLGRKWTKVEIEDGTLRIRAREIAGHLVLERRVKTAVLTETFLPRAEDPSVLYVVARIDGSGIEGLEFRRVYRALHDPAEGSDSLSP